MQAVIGFLLKQRVFFNVLFVGAMLYAAFVAIPQLPVDRYPNFPIGEAEIQADWPGASAEDVESQVTRVLEDAIREDLTDIASIKSTSRRGLAYLGVRFIDDADYRARFDDLRSRLLAVQNQLPVVNGDPIAPRVTEVETDTWLPVLMVAIIDKDGGVSVDNRARGLLAAELQTRLEALPGVRRVNVLGEQPQHVQVSLNPQTLERLGIDYTDVIHAMRDAGQNIPAGNLATALGERSIRVDTRYRSLEDIRAIVVRRDGSGNFITVGDLIEATSTGIERIPGSVLASSRGGDSVNLYVIKYASANAATVKQQTQAEVSAFLNEYADAGITASYNLDSTVKIDDSIGVLQWNLIQGVTLVGIALLFFLTWRSALLSATGILVSFIGTLALFHVLGYSLNTITLLGFVLTVGIIVDDAIVVIENIQRHREEGRPLREACIRGTSEVLLPVLAATGTTICSFLPLLLMTGSTGDFFALIPIAVTCALAISLLECLVLLPIHAVDLQDLLGPERVRARQAETTATLDGTMGRCARTYDRLLRWNLAHPVRAVGIATLLFLLAVGVLVQSLMATSWGMTPLLREKFFPEDTSVFQGSLVLPPGTELHEADRVTREIQQLLVEQGPGAFRTTTGIAGFYLDTSYKPVWGTQFGTIFAELPAVEDRAFSDPMVHLEAMRSLVAETYAEQDLAFELVPQKDSPPTGSPISIRIAGSNDATVGALADDLLAWLVTQSQPDGDLAGAIDLRHDRQLVETVVTFTPDPARLALYDLTTSEVQTLMTGAVEGAYVGDFTRTDGDIPVRVRLAPAAITDPIDLADAIIKIQGDGSAVRFNDIGTLSTKQEPANLVRWNFQRAVTITGNLASDSVMRANDINRAVGVWMEHNQEHYPGTRLEFGGEAASTAKSYASLVTAFGLAVGLIYLILATQFRSFVQPLLILSNIIFSFTGVLLVMGLLGGLALLLPDGVIRPERAMLTVQTFIAVIALNGLVVNDAIVLIDFINRRRNEGYLIRDAVLIASQQRMRPILLTTLTTILGLLAMAIGIPRFAIEWSPMATCFIAGLCMSTIMTMLLVPVLYDRLERARNWAKTRMTRHEATLVDPGTDT